MSTATSGVDALEMLRSGAVPIADLVLLLDINMPRMNGLEFMRALREDSKLRALPVVVFTSSNDANDVRAAYELYCAGYIVKPLTHESYVDVLRSLASYWNRVTLSA